MFLQRTELNSSFAEAVFLVSFCLQMKFIGLDIFIDIEDAFETVI